MSFENALNMNHNDCTGYKLTCCILKPYDNTRVICKEINY